MRSLQTDTLSGQFGKQFGKSFIKKLKKEGSKHHLRKKNSDLEGKEIK